jgi:hypothetical protein
MNILIVSYHYAPEANPRAFRWTALAEYLSGLGHDVTVIAGWKPGQGREEVINGVFVHRVGGSISERLRSAFRGKRGASSSSAEVPAARRAFRAFYASTWRRIYWPDHAALWIITARKAARRLVDRLSVDALITVSHPFSGHWVGLAVKRAFPSLRWVCDIGDPFAFFDSIPVNNHALFRSRNFRAEQQVLTKADAIAVTVEACRREYIRHFPDSADKMAVIPPLLSTLVPTASVAAPPRTGPLRLVYSGTLYPGLREPDYLFRLVGALAERNIDCELHLFGQINGCESAISGVPEHLRQRIVDHGIVTRPELMFELANASVLINIGNRTHYQLPSKLVEYLAAGRPILNLYQGTSDSSALLLAEHPAALSISTDGGQPDDATVTRVAAFVAEPPQINAHSIVALTSRFGIDAVGSAYVALLKSTPGAATKPQTSAVKDQQ